MGKAKVGGERRMDGDVIAGVNGIGWRSLSGWRLEVGGQRGVVTEEGLAWKGADVREKGADLKGLM